MDNTGWTSPEEGEDSEIDRQGMGNGFLGCERNHLHWLLKKRTNSARVHTCAVEMAKWQELKFELLLHLPYSVDLAPSDFFLFPNMKKWLDGKRFEWYEDFITETKAFFEELPKSYFLDGLKKLEKSLGKVHWATRRLFWKKISQPKIIWFFVFL